MIDEAKWQQLVALAVEVKPCGRGDGYDVCGAASCELARVVLDAERDRRPSWRERMRNRILDRMGPWWLS